MSRDFAINLFDRCSTSCSVQQHPDVKSPSRGNIGPKENNMIAYTSYSMGVKYSQMTPTPIYV